MIGTALAGIILLAGCSGTTNPGDNAGSRADAPSAMPPSPAAVSPSSKPHPHLDALAVAASQAWHSWDTQQDGRPDDTMRRLAGRWLCPALLAQLETSQPYTDRDWTLWTDHGARASVRTLIGTDEHPTDTTTTAWRQTQSAITLTGDRGWHATTTRIDWIQFTRPAGVGQWCVAAARSSP